MAQTSLRCWFLQNLSGLSLLWSAYRIPCSMAACWSRLLHVLVLILLTGCWRWCDFMCLVSSGEIGLSANSLTTACNSFLLHLYALIKLIPFVSTLSLDDSAVFLIWPHLPRVSEYALTLWLQGCFWWKEALQSCSWRNMRMGICARWDCYQDGVWAGKPWCMYWLNDDHLDQNMFLCVVKMSQTSNHVFFE